MDGGFVRGGRGWDAVSSSGVGLVVVGGVYIQSRPVMFEIYLLFFPPEFGNRCFIIS